VRDPRRTPISKLLEEIAQPLLCEVTAEWSSQAVQAIYEVAALAWNMSVMRSEKLALVYETLPADVQHDVQTMIRRKERRYRDDRRMVLRVCTMRTAEGFRTWAASVWTN